MTDSMVICFFESSFILFTQWKQWEILCVTDLGVFVAVISIHNTFYEGSSQPASDDVYSNGVVLLELVTGQKAIRKNEQGD